MAMEAVSPAGVKHDAILVIIRLGLGHYELDGPQGNILVAESYVAWSTVANELAGEGYLIVSPGEYAEACGISEEEVRAGIWQEGNLFALAYRAEGGSRLVVTLPEKEVTFPEITGN